MSTPVERVLSAVGLGGPPVQTFAALPGVPDAVALLAADPEVAAARKLAEDASATIRETLAEADALDVRAEALVRERAGLGSAILARDATATSQARRLLGQATAARSEAASLREAVGACAEAQAREAAENFVRAREAAGRRVIREIESGPVAEVRAIHAQLTAALEAAAARFRELDRATNSVSATLAHDERPDVHGRPAEIRAELLSPPAGSWHSDVQAAIAALAEIEKLAGADASGVRLTFSPHTGIVALRSAPFRSGDPRAAQVGEVCNATLRRSNARVAARQAERTRRQAEPARVVLAR